MSNELILVVEDDPAKWKLLRDVLKFKGCPCQNRPALILMDVQLPGMSGIDTLKILRGSTELSDIPVIAVMPSVMDRPQSELLAAGFDELERKPINVASLFGEIRKLLDRWSTA